MNVYYIINCTCIIIYTKIINITIKSCSFHIIYQSFEMFPRNNGVDTILESFALNLIISVPLTNNNCLLHCNAGLSKKKIFTVKLIEYIFSAVLMINMNRQIHVCTKNYYIFTKPTTWERKTSSSIKSNSITRIVIFINVSVFS